MEYKFTQTNLDTVSPKPENPASYAPRETRPEDLLRFSFVPSLFLRFFFSFPRENFLWRVSSTP